MLAGGLFVFLSFRQEHKSIGLYESYFEPAPPYGYTAQRGLAAVSTDEETSILRQAIKYHKETDYDLALVAFRGYLASSPTNVTADYLLLTATAAMASGAYAEGAEYLDLIGPDDGQVFLAAQWHTALLALLDLQPAVADSILRSHQDELGRLGLPVQPLLTALEAN